MRWRAHLICCSEIKGLFIPIIDAMNGLHVLCPLSKQDQLFTDFPSGDSREIVGDYVHKWMLGQHFSHHYNHRWWRTMSEVVGMINPSLAKRTLKMLHVDRSCSLVAHTNKCGHAMNVWPSYFRLTSSKNMLSTWTPNLVTSSKCPRIFFHIHICSSKFSVHG